MMTPPTDLTSLGLEEYRALRATIRERGTARLIVILITFVAWGLLLVWSATRTFPPLLLLAPLLVLLSGFEVVFALHVGVERIGRYLQVRYESSTASAGLAHWEHAAMEGGRLPGPPSGVDPLCSVPFGLAVLVNLLPAALASATGSLATRPLSITLWLLCLAHALVLLRLYRGRRFARTQRARDLAFFAGLYGTAGSK